MNGLTYPQVPMVRPTDARTLHEGVHSLLPDSGVVKVVREIAHERNPLHAHDSEETLLILEGSLTLYWHRQGAEHGLRVEAGEALHLPCRIPHRSQAGPSGCLYLIADRFVA